MSENRIELSIVIPAYNEEGNVMPLSEKIRDVCESITADYEVIFVDDGSTDSTFRNLQAVHAKDDRVKVVKLRKNFGQSAAMVAGFDYSRGKLIITMDADLQNNPADVPFLLEELSNGYDIVCGWRWTRKDLPLKRVFSRLANWLRRRWTGEPIHDSGCSLRAYRRECLNDLQLYGEMHRYIPALLWWRGYRIGEIKVSHSPRVHGKTKYGWQRIVKGFLDLILVTFWQRYSMRPIHIFGGSGLLMVIAGGALAIYLAVGRVIFGWPLADRPLLLLAVMVMLLGVQFVVFGVLADIMLRIYYGQSNRKSYVIKEVIE